MILADLNISTQSVADGDHGDELKLELRRKISGS